MTSVARSVFVLWTAVTSSYAVHVLIALNKNKVKGFSIIFAKIQIFNIKNVCARKLEENNSKFHQFFSK